MCYKKFYVTATALSDAWVRLTCENMALGVVLHLFYVERNYLNANTDALGQKKNVAPAAMFHSRQFRFLSRSPTLISYAA
jgi:hypothetical protein